MNLTHKTTSQGMGGDIKAGVKSSRPLSIHVTMYSFNTSMGRGDGVNLAHKTTSQGKGGDSLKAGVKSSRPPSIHVITYSHITLLRLFYTPFPQTTNEHIGPCNIIDTGYHRNNL